MASDLAVVLGRQETAVLEFKRQAPPVQDLRRIVCALANDLTQAGGGDLLIGVDQHGAAFPTSTDDATLLTYLGVRNDGDLLPRPSMTVTVETYDGQDVVRIHVEATDAPPMRTGGVAHVRPGPQTRPATAGDEHVLSERRTVANLPFDTRGLIGATLEALDVELLRSTYVPAAVAPEVLAENGRPVEQQLSSLRLLDPDHRPTAMGMLIGGFDPTAWIPGAYVQFVRYAGNDVGSEVLDEEEVRDNTITAARTLTSLLQANTTHRPVEVDALRERQVFSYPPAALRELLMNALMHRSYEAGNAPVRIQWFSDRVEISNPGGPFGVVTDQNYDRMNDYRNPALAAALKTLGFVNRFGRGVGRVRSLLEANGNPPAEFLIDRESWTVTVRSA